jgi:hypothetical protein
MRFVRQPLQAPDEAITVPYSFPGPALAKRFPRI